MLELRNIKKDYEMNGETVHALRGISTTFRKNEFVAVLGHSGCGKTTLLNIIGGLDKYTSGELLINGVSTKKYRDRDWDAYRNHSIGFVFQSYNLIPHQTVLANVELALTISGISRSERRRRAVAALEKVGLGDQLKKRPSQMSGGQMQRVAIARALVNDPEILLADEPTGALDSETSVQVMDIIREIAKDRLVIMVTHNPELAEEYATRIIRIKDGLITDDSDPCESAESAVQAPPKKSKKNGRVSMSFFTALSLSLNNLMTKKGRTFMTSFAGSIGIIGIALILSLSNGINTYINKIQKEALSSYPITITKESNDTFAMMETMMQQNVEASTEKHDRDAVYSNTVMYDMVNAMTSTAKNYNDLEKFKKYLDGNDEVQKYASAIQYGYDLDMPIYTKDSEGVIMEADLAKLIGNVLGDTGTSMLTSDYSMFSQINVFQEMLSDSSGKLSSEITDKYELVYGDWPKEYNEVVLIVTKDNELSDMMLYALGFKDSKAFAELMNSTVKGEQLDNLGETKWSYEEICEKKYKIVLPTDKYSPVSDGTDHTHGIQYNDISSTAAGLEYLYNSEDAGTELKICGIIRPGEDADGLILTGAIGYTKALTDHLIERLESSDIMQAQLADPTVDAIKGIPFITETTVLPDDAEKAADFAGRLGGLSTVEAAEVFRYISAIPSEEYIDSVISAQLGALTREDIEKTVVDTYSAEMGVDADTVMGYISSMSDEELMASVKQGMTEALTEQYAAQAEASLVGMSDEMLQAMLLSGEWTDEQYVMMYDEFVPAAYSDGSYEENLALLGYASPEDPDSINIYAETFSDKDKISEIIAEYNSSVSEDEMIEYTDYVELLMSSITDIISGVSYLLVAFVGISLVVSSIMIGIITYISVLERTREIGILRAIGASKRDISNVFNAETLIVGFVSGAIGIGLSVLLCIPINAIIHHLTRLVELKAALPALAGVILVLISMCLTLIAGVIPSRVAAKKDPVEALRSE